METRDCQPDEDSGDKRLPALPKEGNIYSAPAGHRPEGTLPNILIFQRKPQIRIFMSPNVKVVVTNSRFF